MTIRINVIDPDVRRRAEVARHLMARGHHAEIFENLEEFAASGATTGLVFISDEASESVAEYATAISNSANTNLPIVFYTEDPNFESIVDALREGALDYLQWPFVSRLLDKVFDRLANQARYLERQSRLIEAKAKVQELSGRESNFLALLIRGLPN
jgi:FixJ family two-component response regulator